MLDHTPLWLSLPPSQSQICPLLCLLRVPGRWSTGCGGGGGGAGASASPFLQHHSGPQWRTGARGAAAVEQCARRSSPSGGCSLVVVPHPRRGAPLKVFQRISGDALLYVPAASPSSLLLCLLMCAVNPISYMKQGEAISSRSRFRRSA